MDKIKTYTLSTIIVLSCLSMMIFLIIGFIAFIFEDIILGDDRILYLLISPIILAMIIFLSYCTIIITRWSLEWAISFSAPVKIVRATVIGKRVDIGRYSTSYYITFAIYTSYNIEYEVDGSSYSILNEGHYGRLYYQELSPLKSSRFYDFEIITKPRKYPKKPISFIVN